MVPRRSLATGRRRPLVTPRLLRYRHRLRAYAPRDPTVATAFDKSALRLSEHRHHRHRRTARKPRASHRRRRRPNRRRLPGRHTSAPGNVQPRRRSGHTRHPNSPPTAAGPRAHAHWRARASWAASAQESAPTVRCNTAPIHRPAPNDPSHTRDQVRPPSRSTARPPPDEKPKPS